MAADPNNVTAIPNVPGNTFVESDFTGHAIGLGAQVLRDIQLRTFKITAEFPDNKKAVAVFSTRLDLTNNNDVYALNKNGTNGTWPDLPETWKGKSP